MSQRMSQEPRGPSGHPRRGNPYRRWVEQTTLAAGHSSVTLTIREVLVTSRDRRHAVSLSRRLDPNLRTVHSSGSNRTQPRGQHTRPGRTE